MTSLFKDLCWQEKVTFATLLLSMVAMVAWWRLGIIALLLFSVASIIKSITHQHRQKPLPKLLFLLPIYWLLYVVSACYSQNQAEGWDTVAVKLFFLLLPTVFLLDDTRYLTKERFGAVFYTLIAAMVVRFFICIGISASDYLHGVPLETVKDWQIDPLGLHHSYLSLYISVAIAFLYAEAMDKEKRHTKGWWIAAGAATLVMLAYIAISRTRSGMVALAMLTVAAMVHLFFVRKKRLLAVLIFAGICAACGLIYLANPGLDGVFGRFSALFYTRSLGITQDRTIMFQCASETAMRKPIFGYGSGDYMEALLGTYQQHDYLMGLQHQYGSHNQYMETMLECGLIGLVMLLTMIVSPLVKACKREQRNLFIALAILCIMEVIFFESMLNRQMGVQFISLVYCLFIVRLSPSRSGESK